MTYLISALVLAISVPSFSFKTILEEPQEIILLDWNAAISLDILQGEHIFFVRPQITESRNKKESMSIFEISFSEDVLKKYSFEYELCQESALMKAKLLPTQQQENYGNYFWGNDANSMYYRFHSLAWHVSGHAVREVCAAHSGQRDFLECTNEIEGKHFSLRIERRLIGQALSSILSEDQR